MNPVWIFRFSVLGWRSRDIVPCLKHYIRCLFTFHFFSPQGLSPYFLCRYTQQVSHLNYSKLEDSGADTDWSHSPLRMDSNTWKERMHFMKSEILQNPPFQRYFFFAFLTAKHYFSKCETQERLLGTFPKSNLWLDFDQSELYLIHMLLFS